MTSRLDQRWPYIGTAGSAGVDGVMTASITGSWIDVRNLDRISFQESWPATGTPIGALSFDISNMATEPGASDGVDSAQSGWANPSGAAGSNFVTVDLTRLHCNWIRRKYTRTSGGTAATMTVRIAGRGV